MEALFHSQLLCVIYPTADLFRQCLQPLQVFGRAYEYRIFITFGIKCTDNAIRVFPFFIDYFAPSRDVLVLVEQIAVNLQAQRVRLLQLGNFPKKVLFFLLPVTQTHIAVTGQEVNATNPLQKRSFLFSGHPRLFIVIYILLEVFGRVIYALPSPIQYLLVVRAHDPYDFKQADIVFTWALILPEPVVQSHSLILLYLVLARITTVSTWKV